MNFSDVVRLGRFAVLEERGLRYRYDPSRGRVTKSCQACGSTLVEVVPGHAIPDGPWHHDPLCDCGDCRPPAVDLKRWRREHRKSPGA